MKWFMSITLLFSLNAFAEGGSMGGGGGWGVICTHPGTDSFEISPVDRYRFEKRRDHPLPVQLGTGSVESMVETMLARLAKFSPTRAALYRDYIHDMPKEFDLLNDGKKLKGVQDPNLEVDFEFEEGCTDTPVVVQMDRLDAQGKRYLVVQKYWDAFDNASKAIMYFHEAALREVLEQRLALGKIYDEAPRAGRISIGFPMIQTREIRNLNGEIFTNHLESLTFEQQASLIKDLPYSLGIEVPMRGPGFIPMIATKVQPTAEEQLMDPSSVRAAYRLKFELPILTFWTDGSPRHVYLSQIPTSSSFGIDFPEFRSDRGIFPEGSLGAVIEFKEDSNLFGIYPLMTPKLPSSDLFFNGDIYIVRTGAYWVTPNGNRSFTLASAGKITEQNDPNLILQRIYELTDFTKLPLITLSKKR